MDKRTVLVVDDSVFMRKIISDLIAETGDFTVIGTARNGKEAIQKTKELAPGVVTMDFEMPEMNGLEALRTIMKECPVPVIMLSSLTGEGADETIEALEAGAVDFLQKPSGSLSFDLFKVKAMLAEKLRLAVKTRVRALDPAPVTRAERYRRPDSFPSSDRLLERPSSGLSSRYGSRETAAGAFHLSPKPPETLKKPSFQQPPPSVRTDRVPLDPMSGSPTSPAQQNANPVLESQGPTDNIRSSSRFEHIFAIGTSTGGPRALQQVLAPLPDWFPAPILIVQHMPPHFTKSLANRLNSASGMKVVEGEDGMPVEKGTAYVAPGGYHMRIEKTEVAGEYRLRLSLEEPRGGHRPSVDTMFESLLPLKELKRHTVLMTGMGGDGAQGMLALRKSGALTSIAESEETCVVYGMPRTAVQLKAATHVLPLPEIAGKLVELVLA